MRLRFFPYTLYLKHTFTVATSSRTSTPDVLVEIEHNGVVGYGEAAMPPYLGESVETATRFFSSLNLEAFDSLQNIERIIAYVDSTSPGDNAAKAAVDIALHDLFGKMSGASLSRLWGLSPDLIPPTSYTIPIDDPLTVQKRVAEAGDFPCLKVKLGSAGDRAMILAIREVTDRPLRVDVNQGWTDRDDALRMIEFLATHGVELVEQPMPRDRIDDMAWLKGRSPLPLIADESVRRLADVQGARDLFDGINIKLMKSAGLLEAQRMIAAARSLGMSIMIGCMTETSCAISAAAQLAPLADWVDLDGALLIANDPFDGVRIRRGGRIELSGLPGIGVARIASPDYEGPSLSSSR